MQSAAGSRQTAGIGHARALDTTTRNFLPLPSRHEWGEGHSIRVASSPQPSPPLGEERDNISSGQAEVVSSNSVAGATEEGSNLAASTRVETKTRFLQAIASQVGPEVLFGRCAGFWRSHPAGAEGGGVENKKPGPLGSGLFQRSFFTAASRQSRRDGNRAPLEALPWLACRQD